MKGMGVKIPGKMMMKGEEIQRAFMHNTKYGGTPRKIATVGTPLAALGLGVAAIFGARALARSKRGVTPAKLKRRAVS
jgi:hypothetical protein